MSLEKYPSPLGGSILIGEKRVCNAFMSHPLSVTVFFSEQEKKNHLIKTLGLIGFELRMHLEEAFPRDFLTEFNQGRSLCGYTSLFQ